jgi:hypothetical protein
VKQQIVDMAMNASGIRDTARVLHVSPATVIKELKKGTGAPPGEQGGVEAPAPRAHGTSGSTGIEISGGDPIGNRPLHRLIDFAVL